MAGFGPPPAFNATSTPPRFAEAKWTTSSAKVVPMTVAEIQQRYEIASYMIEDLYKLQNYDIYYIVDDSGSMTGARWKELKAVSEQIVSVGGALDADGIDIFRLNGSYSQGKKKWNVPKHTPGVFNMQQVATLFSYGPGGLTPLTETLRKVMAIPTSKPKLIVIATDGLPGPTDINGDSMEVFATLLRNRDAKNNRISMLMCTTQDWVVEQYNDLDRTVPYLDVIDDYKSESVEIRRVQGRSFHYTFGDHVMRLLLSPIVPAYDNMDEKKLRFDKSGAIIPERQQRQQRRVVNYAQQQQQIRRNLDNVPRPSGGSNAQASGCCSIM